MKINYCERPSFTVIGKAVLVTHSAKPSWAQDIWKEANSHYSEVASLAKLAKDGQPVGFWGAMSNKSMSFDPWESNFSEGYYLAGVEAKDDAVAPAGWTAWRIPSFAFVYVAVNNDYGLVFDTIINKYLPDNQLKLAGAVQEFNNPQENGQMYLFFPIERL